MIFQLAASCFMFLFLSQSVSSQGHVQSLEIKNALLESYFSERKVRVIEFQTEYTSRKLPEVSPSVETQESWKIGLKTKSAWKKTESKRYPNSYSEMLLHENVFLNLSFDNCTYEVLSATSWIGEKPGPWAKKVGFGDAGVMLGFVWLGKHYYRLATIIEDGEKTQVGSILTVKFKEANVSVLATFDMSKNLCPIHIELIQTLYPDRNNSKKKQIRLVVDVDSCQKVDQCWFPKHYTVLLESPKQNRNLPPGVKLNNGVLLRDGGGGGQDFVSVAASKIVSEVLVKNVVVNSPNCCFNLSEVVPKEVNVFMQDAPYLPHYWNGKAVVPRVNETFRSQAGNLEFKTDSQRMLGGWGPALSLLIAIVVFCSCYTRSPNRTVPKC